MPSQLVFVVCDNCRKPNPSYFTADSKTLADPNSEIRGLRTYCGHCSHEVLWSKAELLPLSLAMSRFAK